MRKSLLVSFTVSAVPLLMVFVATMYQQYQRIDYWYLAYGLGLIAIFSSITALMATKLSSGKVLASSALAGLASFILIVGLALL